MIQNAGTDLLGQIAPATLAGRRGRGRPVCRTAGARGLGEIGALSVGFYLGRGDALIGTDGVGVGFGAGLAPLDGETGWGGAGVANLGPGTVVGLCFDAPTRRALGTVSPHAPRSPFPCPKLAEGNVLCPVTGCRGTIIGQGWAERRPSTTWLARDCGPGLSMSGVRTMRSA